MKRVGKKTKKAFALPTVLLSSIVMIMILVTAVSVTSSINGSLKDQYYTTLASKAADAGAIMAQACIDQNGGQAPWSDAKPLKPNTDCSGNVDTNRSAYVLELEDVRTYFTVGKPMLGVGNAPVSAASKGYSEVLRNSTGVAWRVWGSDTSVVLAAGGDSTPVGTYIEGAWTTAPSGYLLADGSAVSRTTYANLFAVIGTTYGAGDGSTTFNLPDTTGRVTVARTTSSNATFLDPSGGKPFDTLGELSGAARHTLSLAEMPSHSHAQYVTANSGGTAIRRDYSSDGDGGAYPQGMNTGGAGSSAAHNNVQPSIVVNRAIKY